MSVGTSVGTVGRLGLATSSERKGRRLRQGRRRDGSELRHAGSQVVNPEPRVRAHRQVHVGVPQELLRDLRHDPGLREPRRVGAAERVQVGDSALLVHFEDAGFREVLPALLERRDRLEDARGRQRELRPDALQLDAERRRDRHRVDPVFRLSAADGDRPGLKVAVGPRQPLDLAAAQAGEERHRIESLSAVPFGDSGEPRKLLVGQGAADLFPIRRFVEAGQRRELMLPDATRSLGPAHEGESAAAPLVQRSRAARFLPVAASR